MNKINNKVLLAFSGGLDTSFCAIWLKEEKGMEVHAVTINTGGFSGEELSAIETHALNLGVKSFTVIDGTDRFYNSCIKYLVFGNVLKNGTYPLSVSAERVTQAMLLAEHALKTGICSIAHGSTGAGNDQVRFDMLLDILIPEVEIITPIRDLKLSRQQEIDFLKSHGVQMNFEKSLYSVNKGIWGTSVGGKETLTSHLPLPSEAFPTQITKTIPEKLTLGFEKGELKKVNEFHFENPVDAIKLVNEIASPFGIGRDIHVGDTIIGIKGRVGFEAAAPLLIIKAHHLLGKHVLSKWQLYWKEQIATWYGTWLHEGQYFEPVMRDMEAMLSNSQQVVTGDVFITLHPNYFSLDGIDSPFDLMKAQKGSYGEMNDGWTGDDVKGFTKIFGNQVKQLYQLHRKEKEEFA
ncbi:MAG TPA: argininosuccinate synthase domain-containing protein [Bacteroidia bacterium]|jgi:argininosuccinate synthase|nr:argininosuccinate synthase domain-containing protein [Bacteroidia bacterium]